ncbi:MAG: MmcQ/YjbR family DNA-binding protein [Beijerinckiaceae bacterium]
MTLVEYDAFCASLACTHRVIQWSDAHVWKVGEGKTAKVFAIAGFWDPSSDPDPLPFVTFKCSPMSFDLLKDQPGLRPAPYLASRGMKWIQRVAKTSMDDAALQDYLRESWRLASLNLPKSERLRLGLAQDAAPKR